MLKKAWESCIYKSFAPFLFRKTPSKYYKPHLSSSFHFSLHFSSSFQMESDGDSSNYFHPNATNGIRLRNQYCNCKKRAMLMIAETPRNKNAPFYKCQKCRFFMWLDSNHIVSPTWTGESTVELKQNLENIEMKIDALLKRKENSNKLELMKFGIVFLVVVVVVLGCNK